MAARITRISAARGALQRLTPIQQRVIDALKKRNALGQSLHPQSMQGEKSSRSTYNTAKEHFVGGYRTAVTMIGQNYDVILKTASRLPCRYPSPSKEQLEVIREIKARDKVGKGIDFTSVMVDDKALALKGLAHFEKKWRYVVESSGFDYEKIGILGEWPKRSLIEEMQYRIKEGKSTKQQDILLEGENFEFVMAALHRFKNWEIFLDASKPKAESPEEESPISEDALPVKPKETRKAAATEENEEDDRSK
jgi:hypothetical protein